MKRVLVLIYGVTCYTLFLGVFLYAVGFVGGFLTPTQLDEMVDNFQAGRLPQATLINLTLVAIFGLQHSIMARPEFKRWWTRWIPEPIERSTYMLASNAALGVLYWLWQPMGVIVWQVDGYWARVALWFLFAAGWLTVLVVTFLINHFDLFGLRQVWLYFQGQPYSALPFVTPGPYRFVRHPLYVGWLLAFWATPMMTIAHLVFASAMTAYILIAIRFEEHDLTASHSAYADYRRRVPMLVPQITILATDRILGERSANDSVSTSAQ
jgi:protein-S-isoprenylcysteine O-methyltransferase Ste14